MARLAQGSTGTAGGIARRGRTIVAPLPEGTRGHFGPDLRRFVLMQYHQGQSTLPRLTALLHSVGVSISKREVHRLLTDKQQGFLNEAQQVLRAGLETSSWVSVDDTGARHKAKNGFCTQIGNDWFTWFGTRSSKTRLNFLDLLRAGHTDYVLNEMAFAYMRGRGLSAPLLARLAEAGEARFADQAAWQAHLNRLGIVSPPQAGLAVIQDPVQIATEGAQWGSIHAHGFLRDAVLLSDDAGQFAVGRHALCWVHAERLVHKLDTFTDLHRAAQQRMRKLIWNFYADLKLYRANPSKSRRLALRARFDRIFRRRTGFVTLDRLLKRLHANKAELLMVLERPQIPLHTNGSENDIRCQVIRRKVSAGTRSDAGRDCRDAFLGLAKTCAKHGIAFWSYLGSRLNVQAQPAVPPLSELIRCRGQPA
jgi:transposase IS66 family protein